MLASPVRPDGLFVMTTDTDLGNEMQCAAAVRGVLGDSTARRRRRRCASCSATGISVGRVIGITRIEQLNEALEALARGPLPTAAISKLDTLWANEFSPG